jgi:hypothetical protein
MDRFRICLIEAFSRASTSPKPHLWSLFEILLIRHKGCWISCVVLIYFGTESAVGSMCNNEEGTEQHGEIAFLTCRTPGRKRRGCRNNYAKAGRMEACLMHVMYNVVQTFACNSLVSGLVHNAWPLDREW